MYENVVKDLRHCVDSPDRRGCAEGCAIGKEHPLNYLCISALMTAAADAIEELNKYADVIRKLKCEGWYLQQTKYHDGYQAVATMPLPDPPVEEI